MYIAPNSVIKILKDVPLDPTFDHTIFFNNKEAQEAYFNTKVKYTFNNQMYQRLQRGYMRIEVSAENLYDCNYVMYQNTAFGQRWFYAFITKVEYINNAVAEVRFMLDPMQTWFFDYQLQQCFVEREHSATDVVGDNLLPETVPLSEYMIDYGDSVHELNDVSICIATSFEITESGGVPLFADTGGGIYHKTYSGCDYIIFPNTNQGATQAAHFLEQAATYFKQDGIVNVFYIPTYFIGQKGTDQTIKSIYKSDIQKKQSGALSGYTPRNRKLYTYPYNFLYVTTYQGEAAVYPYEFFTGAGSPTFRIYGDMTAVPTCVLVPEDYKGTGECWDEALALSGWVTCTYNTDAFKAWLAQTLAKGVGLGIVLASAIPTGGASLAAAGVATAGVASTSLSTYVKSNVPQIHQQMQQGGGGTVAFDDIYGAMQRGSDIVLGLAPALYIGHVLGDGIVRQIMPPQSHGKQGGNAVYQQKNNVNFSFYNKHIRPENLAIIDDYFDMFGYATKRKKIPNRNVRPHWCFTKTVGCVITGSIPADDAKAICAIYDRGITFWKNGNEVGNYSLDNRV